MGRAHYRPDGTRRRTSGELAARAKKKAQREAQAAAAAAAPPGEAEQDAGADDVHLEEPARDEEELVEIEAEVAEEVEASKGAPPAGRLFALSKALTRLLRHKAAAEGLPLRPDGLFCLDDVVRTREMRQQRATSAEILQALGAVRIFTWWSICQILAEESCPDGGSDQLTIFTDMAPPMASLSMCGVGGDAPEADEARDVGLAARLTGHSVIPHSEILACSKTELSPTGNEVHNLASQIASRSYGVRLLFLFRVEEVVLDVAAAVVAVVTDMFLKVLAAAVNISCPIGQTLHPKASPGRHLPPTQLHPAMEHVPEQMDLDKEEWECFGEAADSDPSHHSVVYRSNLNPPWVGVMLSKLRLHEKKFPIFGTKARQTVDTTCLQLSRLHANLDQAWYWDLQIISHIRFSNGTGTIIQHLQREFEDKHPELQCYKWAFQWNRGPPDPQEIAAQHCQDDEIKEYSELSSGDSPDRTNRYFFVGYMPLRQHGDRLVKERNGPKQSFSSTLTLVQHVMDASKKRSQD
ncbi:hypothetical protein AK812_SmicGene3312 [Symbiodinium microadriaticum]|uniref:2'-phosphotransferase n=1 Tax=Symbiodinium microadriaticum TaxID=2951 RepID=A0A1Q9EZ40_SYMMI|nr:hypothetical protein AK812_SmicGene3312 [Symbiodinium microadriaticum]